MRSRNIKPGFFKNEFLADCKFQSRLLYSGLWCYADREGRLEDRPRKIKGEIFPHDNIKIEPLLNELEEKHFIARYQFEKRNYIQVINFLEHQKPHPHEAKSSIPQCPKELLKCHYMSLHDTSSNASSLNPSSLNPESLIKHFDVFWDKYPLKKDKKKCKGKWLTEDMAMTEEKFNAIMKGLERQIEWRANAGKDEFIAEWKYPFTWLHNESWEDETITENQSQNETDKPDFSNLEEDQAYQKEYERLYPEEAEARRKEIKDNK